MKKFEFQKNIFETEICGVILAADVTKAEVEISRAQKKLVSFAEKITAGEATENEISDKIMETCQSIDKAFGKGTAEKIFAERTISLHDCMDVVFYVVAALNQFEDGKQDLYKSFGKK